MAKIIEAVARITAEDKTGAVFDKIAKKIEGIAKSSKSSKQVDALAKSLERAQQQMSAIDRFGSAKDGFASARTRFRETQSAVEKAAAAMKRGEGDAKSLQRAYDSAQAAVSRASSAFERQSAAVLSAKRGLEQMGIPAAKAAQAQEKLRKSVESASSAIDRQMAKSERSQRRRQMISDGVGLAGGFLAHEVKKGAGAVMHTYREFDKERRYGKAVMGLTDDQQAPLVKQAITLGGKTKFNDIQVLEAQRDLAARGLNKSQVLGMIPPAASLGQAMDLSLPDAAKQMEGAIFGFKKDTSTQDAAEAAARQTADYQVRASKISGMTPEDIRALYKYGATPARMGSVSEATLLGFGGVLKKANIGGDESGTAFRALMATAQSPTAGAKTALLANGLNYKNYQHMPDRLATAPFADDVAARYGVKLNKGTRAGLDAIFGNKAMIADPAKFAPAVTALLRDQLQGSDAKSLKSIAGAATRYRDKSVNQVDTNALIRDLIPKLANNLPLANAMFGAKQGGRIATALGDPEVMKHFIDEIQNHSGGYADKIADERMAGFDGAVSRLEGSMKNLETAVGRAFDNDGKGGMLTKLTDILGHWTQKAAEQPRWAIGAEASVAGYAGLVGSGLFAKTLMGGFGLGASATALDASAALLSGAARELAGGKALGLAKAAAPGAVAAGGSLWGLGASALPYLGGAVGAGIGGYALYDMTQQPGYDGLNINSPMLTKARGGSVRDAYRRAFNDDRARMGIPALGGDSFNSPEISPTMTYPTAAPGKGFEGVSVSGTVTGEGKIDVTVNAGSSLIDVVKQANAAIRLAGSINSNGPGSLGQSSPDAAAPPPPSTSGGASGVW